MEQFEEQPCLHDENEDTAQETGHYKLPEGAVAATENVCAMQLQGCALWCFL